MWFSVFGWRVALRVHRPRRITRADLEQAGVIVCGPNVEEQYAADVEREIHEFQVMSDLHRVVSENVDARIPDLFEATAWSLGEADDRKAAQTRVLEFLRDLRDIAGRMDAAPAGIGEPWP